MAEPERRSWIHDHAKGLLLFTAALFVAGAATAVVGVTAVGSADDDLAAAEAALEVTESLLAEADLEASVLQSRQGQVEEELADTTREAGRVADSLEAAPPAAAATLAAAEEIAAAGREHCDCDDQLSTLLVQARDAFGNAGEYNRLVDELNSWSDKADTLLEQIEGAIDAVQPVSTP